tara:strand:+ start:1844 stop:2743 length:900 start_codon:yes stop_codon:yes gene_type:complete
MGLCRGVDEDRTGAPECGKHVKFGSEYCWKHQDQDPGIMICIGKHKDGGPCKRNAIRGELFCRPHRRQVADLERLECPRGCGILSYHISNDRGYFECGKCKGTLLNAKNIGTILKDTTDKVATLDGLLGQGVPCELDCPTCEGKMVEIEVGYERPEKGGGGGLGGDFGMGAVDHPIVLVFALVVIVGVLAIEASKEKAGDVGKLGSLILDGCSACGSFWFDKGELDKIKRSSSVIDGERVTDGGREVSPKPTSPLAKPDLGTDRRPELKTAYCTHVDEITGKRCRTISFRGGSLCWRHK